QPGRHAGHDVVEVVAIDLDEFAVLERSQRLGRLPREIAENAHHEREFLLLDRPLGLDLVSDVNTGLPHPAQLVVDAGGRHGITTPESEESRRSHFQRRLAQVYPSRAGWVSLIGIDRADLLSQRAQAMPWTRWLRWREAWAPGGPESFLRLR